MMEYVLGVIGVLLIMLLMGSLVELGGVIIKYFLNKRKSKEPYNNQVCLRIKPQINVAILELLSDYSSVIDSYEIEQNNISIKLDIKIKKELSMRVEDFL